MGPYEKFRIPEGGHSFSIIVELEVHDGVTWPEWQHWLNTSMCAECPVVRTCWQAAGLQWGLSKPRENMRRDGVNKGESICS